MSEVVVVESLLLWITGSESVAASHHLIHLRDVSGQRARKTRYQVSQHGQIFVGQVFKNIYDNNAKLNIIDRELLATSTGT